MLTPKPWSANRWVRCPGSVKQESKFPKTTNEKAREGILIHAIAAKMIRSYARSGLGFPAIEEYVGKVRENVLVTNDMWACALVYAEAVKSKMLEINCFNPQVEQFTEITSIIRTQKAYIDCALENKLNRELHVFELKTGRTIVEVFENWQLINYVASYNYTNYDKIVVHVVQPRAKHADGIVRSWEIDLSLLKDVYIPKLSLAAQETRTDIPMCTPGKQCITCLGIAICDSAIKASYGMYDCITQSNLLEFKDLELAKEKDFLEECLYFLKNRLKTIDTQIENDLRRGKNVQGFTLTKASGNLKWSCDTETIKMLADMSKLTLFKDPEPVTPLQAVQAGIPEEIIDLYASRAESLRVEKLDLNKITRILNETKGE